MSDTLRLEFLGNFAARLSDGATIPVTSRKAQALLAYLALEGCEVSRERIAGMMWGDRRDQRARHNLRQVLSKIRIALGPIITTSGDQLSLDTSHCSADVIDFVSAVAADDETTLGRAIELYGGELLDGFAPREPELEAWLAQSRDRLQTALYSVVDRLAECYVSGGRNNAAIDLLRKRLSVDRAHEPAHRMLMQVFADCGRRSDALRQYDICARALRDELRVEPSAETNALVDAIRSQTANQIPLTPSVAAIARDDNKPRIAVLPFEKSSSDTDEYFVDGITEEIITALSRFHSVRVIARGSSFVYKGKKAPDHEIAEALGAQFLVRGSVLNVARRVRVNVQLLDGSKGLNIWAHRFERELADVFALQDEITATIVSTLAGRVEATELVRAREAPGTRLAAYDYLLRGKDHHHRFNAEDCAMCIEMFGRAIECDPSYAIAHAWLACGLGQAMAFELDEHAKLVDRAQAAAERGLELDENESECHRVLAQVQLTRGNLTRSLRHQERALFLNPNDDRSVCSMGEILTFAGRAEEGEKWVRKALSLNPYHPQRYWTHLARAVFHLGRYQEALEILEQIGRPRRDDLAYTVAASLLAKNQNATAKSLDTLGVADPEFTAQDFVAALPYERVEDRNLLLNALKAAGL